MKSANAGLISLLNSGQMFMYADLYTLTLIDESLLYYSSLDIDVTYGGHTFTSSDLIIERDNVKTIVGVQVDTLTIKVYAPTGSTISNQPFLQAAVSGKLDGATLKLDRGFIQAGAVVGTVNMFNGRISTIRASRISAEIQVKSLLELLNIQMPRNLYQATCAHTLYDSGCTLNKATYGVTGSVNSATVNNIVANASYTNNYYNLGYVLFTSGNNSGEKRTIKLQQGSVFNFMNPLPTAPASGDTFTIYAGCDKTQGTCTSKFSNVINFKGEPFIPVPETMW